MSSKAVSSAGTSYKGTSYKGTSSKGTSTGLVSGRLSFTALTAGAIGVLAVGLCVGATGASAAGAHAAYRTTTTYSITKSGAVHGPSHAAPGYAEIYVAGTKNHLFQLVRARGSKDTKATLVKDGAAVNQGKPAALEDDFKAIGGVSPQQRLFVDLEPGTYFALDVDAHTLTANMIQRIDVSGARSNSARPAITGTVTSIGDMMWAPKPAHIGASGYLQFRNRSKKTANNTHFVDLEKLKKGKTYADVKKVFAGKEQPTAVFDSGPGKSLDTGVIAVGKTQVSSYKLVPGKYMLACFFPDRFNGMPHAFMGMYRVIDVG